MVAFGESECRDVHSYLMRAVAPANTRRDATTGRRFGPLRFISGPYETISREAVRSATPGAALGCRISGAG